MFANLSPAFRRLLDLPLYLRISLSDTGPRPDENNTSDEGHRKYYSWLKQMTWNMWNDVEYFQVPKQPLQFPKGRTVLFFFFKPSLRIPKLFVGQPQLRWVCQINPRDKNNNNGNKNINPTSQLIDCSCDLRANERPIKKTASNGTETQTDRHTNRRTL